MTSAVQSFTFILLLILTYNRKLGREEAHVTYKWETKSNIMCMNKCTSRFYSISSLRSDWLDDACQSDSHVRSHGGTWTLIFWLCVHHVFICCLFIVKSSLIRSETLLTSTFHVTSLWDFTFTWGSLKDLCQTLLLPPSGFNNEWLKPVSKWA